MPQLVFRTTPDGNVDFFNSSWYEFTGFPEGSANGTGWKAALHPDDVERVAAIWNEARRTGEPCEDEYRLKHHSGEFRWVLTRAQPVKLPDGTILRWLGTSTDIHAIKVADQQRQFMLEEMSHRIKNTLTLVQIIASQTLKNSDDLEEAGDALQQRISTLAIAHDQLVRSEWAKANITQVVDAALAPHRTGLGNFKISGPDLPIGSSQAVALTMALHELATNAAKYGALSTEVGLVNLHWLAETAGDRFTLVWEEQGGPPVTQPRRNGFGSKMIEQALTGYFGGASSVTYDPGGLCFELSSPLSGLSG